MPPSCLFCGMPFIAEGNEFSGAWVVGFGGAWRAIFGFRRSNAGSSRVHPVDFRREGCCRFRANRDGKNGRVCASNIDPAKKARSDTVSRSRADPRAGDSGVNGVSVLRTFYRYRDWFLLWRRWLRASKETSKIRHRRDRCDTGSVTGSP